MIANRFYSHAWMKSNRLELNSLTIARDGASLFAPLDITVKSGELLVVRGPNGCGKSSLLKSIAGLLPIAGGSIGLNSRPIENASRDAITYVGHLRGLNPSLSVWDNVAFWAKLYRRREVIDAALHYFDLVDIADVPVRTLSAGWQQRVALTRLITSPGFLWLLDEPSSNLDKKGTELLHSLLETRLEQGGLALMATHHNFSGDYVRILDLTEKHHLQLEGELC